MVYRCVILGFTRGYGYGLLWLYAEVAPGIARVGSRVFPEPKPAQVLIGLTLPPPSFVSSIF